MRGNALTTGEITRPMIMIEEPQGGAVALMGTGAVDDLDGGDDRSAEGCLAGVGL